MATIKTNEQTYRLVCDVQGRWTLQTKVEKDDHTADWMTVTHFEKTNEEGYYEAKKWMEENGLEDKERDDE